MPTEPTSHDPIPAEPQTDTSAIARLRRALEPRTDRSRPAAWASGLAYAAAMVETYLPAITSEARASLEAEQAAQIGALREALTDLHRFHTDHVPAVHIEKGYDIYHCGTCLSISECPTCALLASPAPAVEAYAARLRREGAEAALDVELLQRSLASDERQLLAVDELIGATGRDGFGEDGGRIARIRRLIALGDAFAQVEAWQPSIWPSRHVKGGVHHWNATVTLEGPHNGWTAEGPTPAAALLALAAILAQTEGESDATR